MVEFSAPYLIPLIFLFFLLCIGFGLGNIFSEVMHYDSIKAKTGANPNEARWLLLIVPSLLGIFVILWWPIVQLGGG